MTRLLAPPGLGTLVERVAHPHAVATLVLPASDNAFLVVGRSRRCDVVVDDLSVSREHAALVLYGGQWFVCDRSSTNGTRVNGRRIWGTASVQPGDLVSFGEARFRLMRPGARPGES
jgi:pSer/pThr/pTyr-binding forkhead associated (FHA) protein